MLVCKSHAHARSVDVNAAAHAHAPTKSAARDAPSAVFFAPETLPPELRAALEDALSAQLSLLAANLHYETARTAPLGPAARLRLAQSTAHEQHAAVVFWLETQPDGQWLLYAVDAQARHIITRVVATQGHSAQANIEALALIVRATTAAFIESPTNERESEPLVTQAPTHAEPADLTHHLAAETTTSRERASHNPKRSARDDAGLRVSLGVLGTDFAPKTRLYALELRAAWQFPRGPYVGIGYAAGRALHVQSEDTRWRIAHYPASVYVGLRMLAGPLRLAAEFGAALELRSSSTHGLRTDYTLEPDRDWLVYSLCPRLEAALALTRRIATYVAASTDIVISGNTPYMLISTERATGAAQSRYLVEPRAIRLTFSIGIGIMLF